MRQRSTDDADEDREMDAAAEKQGQGAERRLEEAWRKRKEFGTDRDALVRTQVVSAAQRSAAAGGDRGDGVGVGERNPNPAVSIGIGGN